jgi:hypothetical protein
MPVSAAQVADLVGQLARARRRLAEPERDGRRLALGVLDQDPAGLDAADPPRRVAELEDVAGRALDREVLVDLADLGLLGPLHDGVVVVVGDRAARGDRGEPRAAAPAQHAGDPVAMEVGTGAPAAVGDALGQHREHLLELVVGQRGIRRRAADHRHELVLGDLLGGGRGDDLLREDVEWRVAQRDRVEVAAPHAAHERRALDELVAGQREHPALRRAAEVVARAADALEQRGERARRADLHDQIDRADVDAELERRRRDRALDLAVLELLLRGEPQRARHRAVVGDDVLLAEPLLERGGGPLDQAPRVGEHDRRAVLAHQRGDPVVDPPELLVRGDRAELVVGDLDREVEVAAVSGVDDVRHRAPRADEQPRDHRDRLLGRRQPDAGRRAPGALRDEPVEPLERQREVRAALVARDRVDLVDDHRAQLAQAGAPADGGEQDVERLGGGDQDVRRPPRQLRALADRGVAGAHRDPDVGELDAARGGVRAQLGERRLEVALDVVG